MPFLVSPPLDWCKSRPLRPWLAHQITEMVLRLELVLTLAELLLLRLVSPAMIYVQRNGLSLNHTHFSVFNFHRCINTPTSASATPQRTSHVQLKIQACLVLLHFVLLHFAAILFFKNWRFEATLRRASLGAVFQAAFAHFVSLCHILVILAVFQTFSLYLLCWSVISDLGTGKDRVTRFIATFTVLWCLEANPPHLRGLPASGWESSANQSFGKLTVWGLTGLSSVFPVLSITTFQRGNYNSYSN